jgi:hypothetical protein
VIAERALEIISAGEGMSRWRGQDPNLAHEEREVLPLIEQHLT